MKLGDVVHIQDTGHEALVVIPQDTLVGRGGQVIDLTTGNPFLLGYSSRDPFTKVRDATPADWQAHPHETSSLFSTTSGMDPEIFVTNAEGAVIPAWKFLPAEAVASSIGVRPMRVYWDGWQAEMSHVPGGVNLPRYCHEYCTEDVRGGLWAIARAAEAYSPGATLCASDVIDVDEADLSAKDRYVQLGCAPSRNAYPDTTPLAGIDGRTLPIRFGGCHLHTCVLNVPKPAWWPEGVVVMMDKIAGVLLTALGRGLENPLRRQFYGRPGEFRAPQSPKGSARLEYRTPGSFLMRHPAAFMLGMDMTRYAARLGMILDGRECEIPDVHQLIMDCDADQAWSLIERHQAFYQKVLGLTYYSYGPATLAAMFKTLRIGLGARLGSTTISEAWNLPAITAAVAGQYDPLVINSRFWARMHYREANGPWAEA